jgi:cytochrome d ubiquinol oxidase subunit I
MRTHDAVSTHSPIAVATTLGLFVVMYILVFGTGVGYMLKLVARGPSIQDDHEPGDLDDPNRRPSRPLSAFPDNPTSAAPAAAEA